MKTSALILLLWCLTAHGDPDIQGLWSHTFGGAAGDFPYSITFADNGGYLIAGSSSTYGVGGQYQFWVFRTDSQGVEQWNRTFAFTGEGAFSSGAYLGDGGHIISGNAYPLASGSQMYASRLDAGGNILWEREYGGALDDYSNGVVATTDGGFLVGGTTSSFGSGGQDFFVVKTNGNGDSLWSRTYGGTDDEFCGAVISTTDGGFLLFGSTTSFAALGTDMWALKIDANGDSLWSQSYDANFSCAGTCACRTSDGGYVLGGMTVGGGTGQDFWVQKVNGSGVPMWDYVVNRSGEDVINKVAELPEGGFALCGYTETQSAGGRDFYIAKLNDSGSLVWDGTFGGYDVEQALGMLVEGNGSHFVLTGNTLSFGAGNHDAWMVKAAVDSVCPQCGLDIVSCEYWLDSDPGQGSGSALSISPSGLPTFDGTINTAALPIGLHTLGVRFKDDRDIWSSSEVRLFYVLGNIFATDIVEAEYWLDTDPGAGSGTALTITQGANPVAIASLPFESAPIGLHSLGIRFKDDRDIWSSSEVRLFYVIGNNSATDIVEAEYWLDTDPGAGGGTALTITQGANPVAIASLPFESAPIGLHSLGIRFKDDRDIWSSSEVRLFYVVNPIYMAAGHIIAGAEYFINYDPGEGSGAPIALPTDGNWDSAFETITDSVSNIPGGKHWLGVRFLDDRGIWSNVLIDSFTVTPILTITVNSSHLPVLYWESADNATEFQIFRATNLSGPFTQIAVTTDSTFTDNENPAAGEKRYYQITETVAPGMAGFRLPNRNVRSTSKRASN